MPHLTTDDGVKLYYEEVGSGVPIVFVHEFASDTRSWELQVRHFGRRYRCIAFNARGYPPSDVPDDGEKYSQACARDDIRTVLDALKIDKAHIVGLSMGGFATLHFGFTYPNRARSLVIAGCGYGAEPSKRAQFAAEAEASAKRFEELTIAKAAGSSRLTAWPVFGTTTRAALEIIRFINSAGSRHGQSSSPVMISVGVFIVFISSTTSYSDGRRFCTPRMVSAAPVLECCASCSANSCQPRGSLFWNCTRDGPSA